MKDLDVSAGELQRQMQLAFGNELIDGALRVPVTSVLHQRPVIKGSIKQLVYAALSY
jgi:hypothetical protein